MKTTVLPAPVSWWGRSSGSRKRGAPAPLRARTTASWAREARQSSDFGVGIAARGGRRQVVRTAGCFPGGPGAATEPRGRLVPYLGAAAVVFALVLNIRPLLAAFVYAVELLRWHSNT